MFYSVLGVFIVNEGSMKPPTFDFDLLPPHLLLTKLIRFGLFDRQETLCEFGMTDEQEVRIRL